VIIIQVVSTYLGTMFLRFTKVRRTRDKLLFRRHQKQKNATRERPLNTQWLRFDSSQQDGVVVPKVMIEPDYGDDDDVPEMETTLSSVSSSSQLDEHQDRSTSRACSKKKQVTFFLDREDSVMGTPLSSIVAAKYQNSSIKSDDGVVGEIPFDELSDRKKQPAPAIKSALKVSKCRNRSASHPAVIKATSLFVGESVKATPLFAGSMPLETQRSESEEESGGESSEKECDGSSIEDKVGAGNQQEQDFPWDEISDDGRGNIKVELGAADQYPLNDGDAFQVVEIQEEQQSERPVWSEKVRVGDKQIRIAESNLSFETISTATASLDYTADESKEEEGLPGADCGWDEKLGVGDNLVLVSEWGHSLGTVSVTSLSLDDDDKSSTCKEEEDDDDESSVETAEPTDNDLLNGSETELLRLAGEVSGTASLLSEERALVDSAECSLFEDDEDETIYHDWIESDDEDDVPSMDEAFIKQNAPYWNIVSGLPRQLWALIALQLILLKIAASIKKRACD